MGKYNFLVSGVWALTANYLSDFELYAFCMGKTINRAINWHINGSSGTLMVEKHREQS